MDDSVILQAILTFWAGVFSGLVLGGLVGWRTRFAWGMATGLLIIGAGGVAGAGWLGWHRYQTIAATESVTGILVDWVHERLTDADGKSTVTHAPIVRFKALDGKTYRIKGLGRGNIDDLPPGSAVQVRYRPESPGTALIADFQNQWSGVWALGLFGVIPMMMGAFFLATAINESHGATRIAQPRPLSAQRSKHARYFSIAGGILLPLSFASAVFAPDALHAIGYVFVSIAVACATLAAGSIMRREEWQTPAILLLLSTTFALFGFGAVMLG